MKILRMIGTLDPAYGGPVEGLRQSVLALQKLGHPNEVVTLDKPGSPWLEAFPSIVHPLGPSRGKYRYNPNLIPWLKNHGREFDAIVVHGIWQFQSFATWIISRENRMPYLVFVHGALDPWFRNEYPIKHLKKWLYWYFAEYWVLRNAAAVLFTSVEEKQLASKSFGLYRVNKKIINYGIQDPGGDANIQRLKFLDAFPILKEKRRFLFLSRFHLKKGCDILIKAFAQFAKTDPSLFLIMAGPDSDSWTPALKKMAQELDIENQIVWTGLLLNDMKWGAICAADAFILPSHSENFGVAVVEALACSVPVLITDKVNIWQQIKNSKAGLVSSDSVEGILHSLQVWHSLTDNEKNVLRENARQCFLQNFEITKSSETFIETIKQVTQNRKNL